jgi:hypothetical protein
MPEWTIFNSFDEGTVRHILNMQVSRIKQTGINPHIFLLFDDFASDAKLRYTELFTEVSTV